MKMQRYMPDPFPIRYSIILEDYDDEKSGYGDALRAQLLSYLQSIPLVASDLRLGFSGFEIHVAGESIASMVKLITTRDWHESAKQAFENLFPDGKLTGIGDGSLFPWRLGDCSRSDLHSSHVLCTSAKSLNVGLK